VVSYKQDGNFHRSWDSFFIIEETKDYYILGNHISKIIEDDGRVWYSKDPVISIFYKETFKNIICMIKNTGIKYYVNLASPSFFHEQTIYYIDYDLDITYSLENGINILDYDEYEENKIKYNYSAELIYSIQKETQNVIKLINQKEFPFNTTKIMNYYNLIINLK
jgi:protein associated with RNAse G/E